MKPSDFWRQQLLRQPNNREFKASLIHAVISNEISKPAEQIYADHFAPNAPDQELRGSQSLKQVQALCCRFLYMQFLPHQLTF